MCYRAFSSVSILLLWQCCSILLLLLSMFDCYVIVSAKWSDFSISLILYYFHTWTYKFHYALYSLFCALYFVLYSILTVYLIYAFLAFPPKKKKFKLWDFSLDVCNYEDAQWSIKMYYLCMLIVLSSCTIGLSLKPRWTCISIMTSS